jgi:hypothetical protein
MADTDNSTSALAAVMRRVIDGLPEPTTGRAVVERLQQACHAPTLSTVAAAGQTLLSIGFPGHAAVLFEALSQFFPNRPAGLAGLAHVAMQRKHWVSALALWEEIIATFPAQRNGYWLATRARVLTETGQADEAEAILQELAREFGHQPHALIGLAHLAMHKQRWSDALALWDEVLARYPLHDSAPFSKTARAGVLVKLGRHAEAEAGLREIAAADSWMIGAQVLLMHVLVGLGRSDEAAQVARHGPFADGAVPVLCRATLWILLRGQRLDEARMEFERILPRTAELESISLLIDWIPILYEGARRMELRRELLRQLDGLEPFDAAEGRSLHALLCARLRLGLRDYSGYLSEIQRLSGPERFGELGHHARAVAAALASPDFPDHRKRTVFGIGLPRTGTTSLAAALKVLGMSTAHWTNPLTSELLSEDDVQLFDALTDAPMCLEFEEYYRMFPASKFIYTVRPLESWVLSMKWQWQRMFGIEEYGEFQRRVHTPAAFGYGRALCRIAQSLFLNYTDLAQAYEAYDLRVRRFFSDKPPDRFLVFDLFGGHGWRELCGFLGTHVPAIPFPFENRAPTGHF